MNGEIGDFNTFSWKMTNKTQDFIFEFRYCEDYGKIKETLLKLAIARFSHLPHKISPPFASPQALYFIVSPAGLTIHSTCSWDARLRSRKKNKQNNITADLPFNTPMFTDVYITAIVFGKTFLLGFINIEFHTYVNIQLKKILPMRF